MVVANFVVEHLHPVVGVDEDAGTGRHPGHRRARNAEVGGVVVNHSIVEHPGAVAFLRQVRHVEHQNAAGVVDCHIAEHVRMDGVLDLDARHVEFGPAVADHDVARLADVDAGVRCADGHRALDEGVFGLHRVNAVGAVLSARAAGPFGAHPAHGDVAPVGDFQGIAGCVLNGKILNGEVAGRHQQAFGTRQLSCEAQDGLIHARPTDRDAVRVEHQAPVQAQRARRNLNDRPGHCRLDLQPEGLLRTRRRGRRRLIRRLATSEQCGGQQAKRSVNVNAHVFLLELAASLQQPTHPVDGLTTNRPLGGGGAPVFSWCVGRSAASRPIRRRAWCR